MSQLADATIMSLRVATLAIAGASMIALPAAFFAARRKAWWLSAVETLLTIPIVLPPIVSGYFLLMLLGRSGPLGKLSVALSGKSLLFTETAAVIAAAVVSLPLVYLPAKSAFATLDNDLVDTARLWGASTWTLFWHISLPMARRGIAAGLVLGFARALGEFGATVMVLSIHSGRTTLPISIYVEYESGELANAWPAVCILVVVSLLTVLLYNRANRP